MVFENMTRKKLKCFQLKTYLKNNLPLANCDHMCTYHSFRIDHVQNKRLGIQHYLGLEKPKTPKETG